MAIRNWKDIPLFKDVTDEQWNDWHWQVAHRLSTVEEIAQVVNLTEQEKEDIEKVMGGFRVGITPYYASLIDPVIWSSASCNFNRALHNRQTEKEIQRKGRYAKLYPGKGNKRRHYHHGRRAVHFLS